MKDILTDSEGYKYIIKEGKKKLLDSRIIKNWGLKC